MKVNSIESSIISLLFLWHFFVWLFIIGCYLRFLMNGKWHKNKLNSECILLKHRARNWFLIFSVSIHFRSTELSRFLLRCRSNIIKLKKILSGLESSSWHVHYVIYVTALQWILFEINGGEFSAVSEFLGFRAFAIIWEVIVYETIN